jgi:FkbM family methyltransferase
MQNVRSLLRDIAPPPFTRFARKVLIWKRDAAFHSYVTTKNIGGESFRFYVGDSTAKEWYEGDHHEWWMEIPFILQHMLAANDLVFEVGSHHGFHLIPIARRVRQVIAIEPHPHNVSILRKNIALNTLTNVTVYQAAIGDAGGKATLLQETSEGGLTDDGPKDRPTISVDLLSLDMLAQRYGQPQMLKIDVEGFEHRVIKGASQIMRHRPKIALEVHVDWISRYGCSVTELLDLLPLDDYAAWCLDNPVGPVKPWDWEAAQNCSNPKFHMYLLPRGKPHDQING